MTRCCGQREKNRDEAMMMMMVMGNYVPLGNIGELVS